MGSLKRSRQGSTEPDRNQKRVCSDPFHGPSLIDVRGCPKNPATEYQSFHEMARSDVFKRCVHKTLTLCSLFQPICCACADKRVGTSGYMQYIDRLGDTFGGDRWDDYCLNCNAYWNDQANQRGSYRKLRDSSKAQGLADEIRITCADQTFDFFRSDGLTLDDLRAELGLLMQCDPYHLILVASDIDMQLETQSANTDFAAFISHANRIHFRRIDIMDFDDEMDGMEDIQCPEKGRHDSMTRPLATEQFRSHWQSMWTSSETNPSLRGAGGPGATLFEHDISLSARGLEQTTSTTNLHR